MDCGVSFCLCGDPDYFSITTRPWLPHSSQSFTINCGLFAAILDENVGIYQFFHNSNKQDLKHATSIIWTLHTYVHVFHQQMNIQPILIGTTNWYWNIGLYCNQNITSGFEIMLNLIVILKSESYSIRMIYIYDVWSRIWQWQIWF